MSSTHRFSVIAAALLFSVSLAGGQGPDPSVLAGKIADWPAPATWSPDSASEGVSTMGAVTSPLPFVGLAPCRIVDTRGNGFTGAYGPPALTQGSPRNFTLSGRCGIPADAQAVSLNVTVTNTQGPGFILIFPQGAAQPDVSTLNYVAGQTIANAAVVPLGAGGGIAVIAGVSGTNLILDTNGYYAGAGNFNTFLGLDAGNFTMTGAFNTGIGRAALFNNTTGSGNTAIGESALLGNTSGGNNTAIGTGALNHNTTSFANTATGEGALYLNTMGDNNTATGADALFSNTLGVRNIAIGGRALHFNTTGSRNIAIGYNAGTAILTGNDNIDIANPGSNDESGQIRIGTAGVHNGAVIQGIYGGAIAGLGVVINAGGRLGTTPSSRRFKEDIRDIDAESDGLMRLRPVAFKYKAQIDPTGLPQYGLIAEEVADVYPDLVAYDGNGRPETVRYHLVNALLLNEVQKQHGTIEQQKVEIEALQARLSRLEGRLLTDSHP